MPDKIRVKNAGHSAGHLPVKKCGRKRKKEKIIDKLKRKIIVNQRSTMLFSAPSGTLSNQMIVILKALCSKSQY